MSVSIYFMRYLCSQISVQLIILHFLVFVGGKEVISDFFFILLSQSTWVFSGFHLTQVINLRFLSDVKKFPY